MPLTYMMMRIACGILIAIGFGETALANITLVEDGQIAAVVVTADDPSPVAAYAVEELINHVEKATGKRLPVAVESAIPDGYVARIFVGETEAARAQDIDADLFEVEEYVLRTVSNDLYIVGKELHEADYTGSRPHGEPWNPLSGECVHSGTLFGVYQVLERFLGVRWLWPGDLGSYVPRTVTVEIPALDETIRPRLLYRNLDGWDLRHVSLSGVMYDRTRTPRADGITRISEAVLKNLIFPNEEAGHAYGLAMNVFMRRHRRVTPIEPVRVPRNSHEVAGIEDWWAEFGEEHPEWFALVDGKRGDVGRSGAYTNLCVSNEELRAFIVNEAWDGGDVLVLGDGDGHFCECDECMAWDGPQPENPPWMVRDYTCEPHAMGGRYARFWKDIYENAVKRNPNVKVTAYIYGTTFPAPLTGIQLNKNIFGEVVVYGGWNGWYPMSEEEYQWTRDQWLGWSNTGISMFFRPNYLLNLYVTPNITTRQPGEYFQFAYQHGMIGASFDAYSFSWAVHGPMAYMHYCLMWNPELDIDGILREYYSAFGPAAHHVQAYFDYWEKYARTRPAVSEVTSALEKLRRSRGHYMAYPPEVYSPAEEILERALEAAREDPLPEFAERVEFLQAGIEHALLTTRIYAFLEYEGPEAEVGRAPLDDPEKLKQARAATKKLVAFRQDPKNRFVSAYIDNAMVERNFIKGIDELFKED